MIEGEIDWNSSNKFYYEDRILCRNIWISVNENYLIDDKISPKVYITILERKILLPFA
jgi:hypothetical protein